MPVWLLVLAVPLPQAVAAINLSDADQSRLDALYASHEHGLEPADYNIATLEALLQDDSQISSLDIESVLNQSFHQYSHDIANGRLNPLTADPDWHIPLLEVTHDLPPSHKEYQRLKQALAKYRRIEQEGGWPQVPPGPDLVKGMRHEQVITLRNRLRITGDFDSEMLADPYYFDQGLEQAVIKFRERHGQAGIGTVTKATRATLNVPVEDRISQILVTMERWRWLPRDPGDHYVWVNLANADMQIIEKGEPVFSMRVIIGRPYRSTPSFRSEIDRVVFNPAWSVPKTIAVEDILPQQKNDVHFISRKHIRVFKGVGESSREVEPDQVVWKKLDANYFPYRLRQDAGPKNSLGRLKFMFDNPFDIYMHDTPAKLLFDLPRRAFSSGCVRLEKSAEFAAYLLARDKGWDLSEVQSQIDRSITQTVRLDKKVPVYFVYLTSWVTKNDVVNFREDVYDRDAKVAKALNQK